MKQILSDIGDLITGKSNTPPNPDVQHNVKLLQEARQKVETGIFSKYFRRPYIVLMETVFYSATLFFIGLAIIFSIAGLKEISPYVKKIELAENVIQFANSGAKIIDYKSALEATGVAENMIHEIYSVIKVSERIIIFLMFIPSLFTFLLARSYTKSRRRLSKLIEVESIIEKVIYNLGGK